MSPLPILRDAWYFFSRNLTSLAVLCLPLILLESVVGYFVQQNLVQTTVPSNAPMAYALLVGLIFSPLYKGALILYMGSRSDGFYPSNSEIFKRALGLWPAYALLSALTTLAVLSGLMLMVIPGIWLMIKLIFADFQVVLHGRAPMAAMRESFTLTTGKFWPITGCLLLAMLALSGPWLVLAWLISPEAAVEPNSVLAISMQSVMGFLQLFVTVVAFRLYTLIEPQAQTQ